MPFIDRRIGFYVLILLILSSCRVLNPTQMLRTGKNYPYSKLPDNQVIDEYRIAPNDLLEIAISTNNGQNLINPAGGSSAVSGGNNKTYLVEFDGMVNIPLLNRIKLSDMSLRECESFLQEKFCYFFKEPYVQVKVLNSRVIVFPGGKGGGAKVLLLEHTNTTLFEALALAGGISDGKDSQIKLIRGELQERKIFLIDLSKIEGLKDADIVLKANDIIYIEPIHQTPQEITSQITPYFALFSTFALIYTLFR